MRPWRWRARSSGAASPGSRCRAPSPTWRSAPGWPLARSALPSRPRSRRSTPRPSRSSPTAPPTSTRSRAAGFSSASTLRKRMIALAGEIAEGMVFSGGSRAHMTESLAVLPAAKRNDPAFFIGNRIRTCISDDVGEAKAVLRRTMTHYAHLPYYRNYWKEAGYTEEMTAIEAALAAGRPDEVPRYLTDRWLADVTLFGPAAKVRDGIEAWREAGIRTPVVVPLSADGDQNTALAQVFAAFAA